jgi:phosphoserine phosphatase
VAPFPYRLVTVDIDGTLTLEHGWAFVARKLGRTEQYDRTQSEFREGTIDEDVHLRNLLAIADGVSESELTHLLAETPKVDRIGESVRRLHGLGSRVALLTHNPGYVTGWYERTFGFDGADGLSGAPQVVDGRIGSADGTRADKVAGLGRLCERFGVGPREVAHVGDGVADAEIFPLVGLGVAYRTRIEVVRRAADLTLDTTDLGSVVDALARTRPART